MRFLRITRSLHVPSTAPPCTLVIFGARGDLTKRLLMPALYNLSLNKRLDPNFRILGVDHSDTTKSQWIASLSEMMQEFVKDDSAEFHPLSIDDEKWAWITKRCEYMCGDFNTDATYTQIAKKLNDSSAADVRGGNVIFYIAAAPTFFARVVDGLSQARLLAERENAFRRVVIEKPFGSDAPSAKALNANLLAHASEAQLYRIDHFMGKEAVRGIFTWRFSNGLFEPIWNHEHIDHIEITAAETIGVEERGAFYEATGALRDMVPSHLFSVLTMVAMEPPASLESEVVRDAHAKLLQAIVPLTSGDAVRGQYRAGEVQGTRMPAYCDADNVAKNSRTETYAAIRLHINTPRWQGVPFYIRTGKALRAHTTSVAVLFKPSAPLRFDEDAIPCSNMIRFGMSGNTVISTYMGAKKPGPEDAVKDVTSDFHYEGAFPDQSTVGYESLLFDCMQGEKKLFLREDAIDAGWQVLQPVLDAWAEGGEPQLYAAGSRGPSDADALLAASGRAWLPFS